MLSMVAYYYIARNLLATCKHKLSIKDRIVIVARIIEEQMGLRKDMSTIDALFVVEAIIKKRLEFNWEAHVALVGMQKRFWY